MIADKEIQILKEMHFHGEISESEFKRRMEQARTEEMEARENFMKAIVGNKEAPKTMTEQEAKLILNVRVSRFDHANDVNEALEVAISALEEIQQYREFKKIFEEHMSDIAINVLSDQTEFGKWLDRIIWTTKKCDEIYRELEKYRELGTVEEIKDKLEQLQIDEAIISLPSDCVVCKEKKELEKYKALGTVEELREAMEKQKAKRPYLYMNEIYVC